MTDLPENPFDFESLYDEEIESTPESLGQSGGGGYSERLTRNKVMLAKLVSRERKLTKKNKGVVPVFRYHDYKDIYEESL